MGDKHKTTEAAKKFQEGEDGRSDSSSQFAATHQEGGKFGIHGGGGKAATAEPATDEAEAKTEGGIDYFPDGKDPEKQ